MGLCGFLVGIGTTYAFILDFGVFVLAIFTGYLVIWNVTPSLHTPLMSETNAISGIIVIGCMTAMNLWPEDVIANNKYPMYSICAWIGLFVASINVWGGFLVTHRMLAMFKLE